MSPNSLRSLANPRADRPSIPVSYGIQPAPSGEGTLPWSFVGERMKAARNYWVVSSSREGRPHAAPVWGIWAEGTFFFATDAASRKARNLHLNPQVVVHLESGDEVVILEGRVEVVDDKSLQARLDAIYFAKYAFHMEGGPIYRVQVEKALAWRERDFPSSATRFQMQG